MPGREGLAEQHIGERITDGAPRLGEQNDILNAHHRREIHDTPHVQNQHKVLVPGACGQDIAHFRVRERKVAFLVCPVRSLAAESGKHIYTGVTFGVDRKGILRLLHDRSKGFHPAPALLHLAAGIGLKFFARPVKQRVVLVQPLF